MWAALNDAGSAAELVANRRMERYPVLLAIEQGNTNSLFAIHDGERWLASWRASTEATRTADEYAVWLAHLMAMAELRLKALDACIISTVVPQSLFNLRNLARRYLGVEPLIVGENANLGIEIRVGKPAEVGADRLVNALGAHVAYPGSLIVIDSGTATTIDLVSSDGAFEGGVIAPGIHLSVEALHSAAAKLPRVALGKPEQIIGTDTVSAIQSGVFWGYISLIEGMVARIKDERKQRLTVVATGGIVPLFRDSISAIDHFDPDITLRGLLEIFRRNATQ
jgi:type III pantothenate kinase